MMQDNPIARAFDNFRRALNIPEPSDNPLTRQADDLDPLTLELERVVGRINTSISRLESTLAPNQRVIVESRLRRAQDRFNRAVSEVRSGRNELLDAAAAVDADRLRREEQERREARERREREGGGIY